MCWVEQLSVLDRAVKCVWQESAVCWAGRIFLAEGAAVPRVADRWCCFPRRSNRAGVAPRSDTTHARSFRAPDLERSSDLTFRWTLGALERRKQRRRSTSGV